MENLPSTFLSRIILTRVLLGFLPLDDIKYILRLIFLVAMDDLDIPKKKIDSLPASSDSETIKSQL